MPGGWRLSGTKTWSSRAAFADRAFGLFRTDPAAERHRGLSYLMLDLRAPGVTVRPIRQLGGETGFAEIFLDEVLVPDADVIGAPGDGWRIAMSTASHERGLSLRSPGRFLAAAARLTELWQRVGDPADTALRDRVADAWIGARAYQLRCQATAQRLAEGGALGAEASLGKVFWSELDVALHETALDLLGPHGAAPDCAAGRRGRAAGSTATCSPWPAPSTRAPTRSSAVSSPSASWDSPGDAAALPRAGPVRGRPARPPVPPRPVSAAPTPARPDMRQRRPAPT